MVKLPTVAEFMDTESCTLAPETAIREAVSFLIQNRRTGAPVINADNEVVGLLSEYDCLRLLALGSDAEQPEGTVADFMTANPTTIPPHMNVYYAAGMFMGTHFRRFPVVENGKLVGAITRFDILHAINTKL
jgi:CBS domain-containing protein